MGRSASKLIESYIPMSEAGFLVLLCLLEPRHGYGIMREIYDQSGGRVNIGTSTIYTILYRMEQDGLVEVHGEIDRRKVYRITAEGRSVLEAEANRITKLANFASARLGAAEAKASAASQGRGA